MTVYVPQLTAYSPDNVYTSPYYRGVAGGYTPPMPNCTRYAYGRWWALMGTQPVGLGYLGNAEEWFANCTAFSKLPATDPNCVPKLGSIICFADGPYSGWGHVVVVEQIFSNGVITTSESALNGYMFQTRQGSRANNFGYHPAYRFQGIIYFPEDYDPPDPGPDPPPDPPDPPGPYPPAPSPFGFKKPLWFYCKRRPF